MVQPSWMASAGPPGPDRKWSQMTVPSLARTAGLDELLSVLAEACRILAAELEPFIPADSSALSNQVHTHRGSTRWLRSSSRS